MRGPIFLALMFGVAVMAGAEAQAQTWPARPIKLVVATGPGSATDIMARLLSDGLSRRLAQPVVVENIAGASGLVGHQAVARAAPDGHTLLFTATSGLAINPISFKSLPYDPRRDFLAIAMVCSLGPQMLSVNAELPVSNGAEFLAYARQNRGRLPMAFDATAGAGAFAAKLMNKRSDLQLIEVPYRSVAQMIQDMSGGTTKVLMSSIAAAAPAVDAGKVRRIAVTSATRFPGLPDLPPLNDFVPGVVVNGWFAIVAPAGVDRPVVDKLNAAIADYLKEPEIQSRLLSFGLATEGAGTPESTAEFIEKEQQRWQSIANDLAIEPQ